MCIMGLESKEKGGNMEDIIIHEYDDYKITQHPIHGLYLVSYFDKDLKKWLGIETCNTPAECHQVIKRCEDNLMIRWHKATNQEALS